MTVLTFDWLLTVCVWCCDRRDALLYLPGNEECRLNLGLLLFEAVSARNRFVVQIH